MREAGDRPRTRGDRPALSHPPGLLIRPARAADGAAIVALFLDSYADQHLLVRHPVPDRSYLARVAPGLRRALPRMLVALQAGRVVGAIEVGRGRIEALAVDRAWHRRGIGRALMHKALMHRAIRCAGGRGVTLEIQATDRRAHAFYRGLGFRPVRRLDGAGLRPYPEPYLRLARRRAGL